MKYNSKHEARDQMLPEARADLLESILDSLKPIPDVMAVYLGGSLAKGNADLFSDIDLRIVVNEAQFENYIQKKQQMASQWGKVLFFEDMIPSAPFTIAH